MIALYFGSFAATLTTLLVFSIASLLLLGVFRRARIAKWGRLVALIVLVGTAASALSATRDGYGAAGALFPMDGIHALLCGVAGGLIYLIAIACVFFKRQSFRRGAFYAVSGLMLLQIAVVEGSRIALWMGGCL